MPTRILVFDYSGHPFQVQLSRELARRGHNVLHIFSTTFQTPKGNLTRQPGDPAGFAVRGIGTAKPFQKHSFVRRRQQEIELGQVFARTVAEYAPDIVISSNAPLDVQRFAIDATHKAGSRFVFWLQDVYSRAITAVLSAKIPVAGAMIGKYYTHLEFDMLRRSDAVVVITDDFVPLLVAKGVCRDRIFTVQNWSPLDDVRPTTRDNAWADAHMTPPEALRIVYSGTIGYKHNPALLTKLAQRLPQAQVYVFSEGKIAAQIAGDARQRGLANFSVRPWVPFTNLSDMLSGADIVVALIEPEAGIYSVPSKVLTYLAIGRPILASVPAENLAARTITDVGAGLVAEPGDDEAFLAAAEQLVVDNARRACMASAGRAYALKAFDISSIGDRFEELLEVRPSRIAVGERA